MPAASHADDATDPREMLARLVAFPTVSERSNLELIDFVEGHLGSLGVDCARVPDATGQKASLIARVGPKTEGGIVLSGHTDVVPVSGQDWTTDPFVLTERDGKLFGRGTCDMKGFIACGLALAPEMLAAGLARPIYFALSYDEEVGCLGAPEMIDRLIAGQPRPEAVIVGEPSMMRVVTGHKGSWGFRAHVRGHEVHSSRIHTGVSAVMTAARLVTWMDDAMAANALAAGAFGLRSALHHAACRPDRRRDRGQHRGAGLHPGRRNPHHARRDDPRTGRIACSARRRGSRRRRRRSTPTPASP